MKQSEREEGPGLIYVFKKLLWQLCGHSDGVINFPEKCVSRELNTVLLIKESGANHLPIQSSMDLLISLCLNH